MMVIVSELASTPLAMEVVITFYDPLLIHNGRIGHGHSDAGFAFASVLLSTTVGTLTIFPEAEVTSVLVGKPVTVTGKVAPFFTLRVLRVTFEVLVLDPFGILMTCPTSKSEGFVISGLRRNSSVTVVLNLTAIRLSISPHHGVSTVPVTGMVPVEFRLSPVQDKSC